MTRILSISLFAYATRDHFIPLLVYVYCPCNVENAWGQNYIVHVLYFIVGGLLLTADGGIRVGGIKEACSRVFKELLQ